MQSRKLQINITPYQPLIWHEFYSSPYSHSTHPNKLRFWPNKKIKKIASICSFRGKVATNIVDDLNEGWGIRLFIGIIIGIFALLMQSFLYYYENGSKNKVVDDCISLLLRARISFFYSISKTINNTIYHHCNKHNLLYLIQTVQHGRYIKKNEVPWLTASTPR